MKDLLVMMNRIGLGKRIDEKKKNNKIKSVSYKSNFRKMSVNLQSDVSKEPLPKPNSIVLMTIDGAKGKEFDHVYLIGLVDDELPSFQRKKEGAQSSQWRRNDAIVSLQ